MSSWHGSVFLDKCKLTMKRFLFLTFFLLSSFVLIAEEKHLVGGDISLLPRYEQYSTPYYTSSGEKIDDVLLYMRDVCGMNVMRVRLFVNPSDTKQEGVVQDLGYVKALGKRIKDAGMKFMLDFHYSDTWADPVSQKLPAEWSDCKTAEQKAERVYSYTKDCLNELKAAGATPDLVQVGNEISYGMVDIQVHPYDVFYAAVYPNLEKDDWDGFLAVLTQGCKAVREACPDAQIIIHTERAGKTEETEYFYKKLSALDYDIIGLSYYPFWHGDLATLGKTLDRLASAFADKDVQIVETAYYYQYFPTSDKSFTNTTATWADTPAGQQKFAKDLIAELNKHDNVNGLLWWFPEENGNGGPKWNASTIVIKDWVNRGLWDNDSHKALPALYELKAYRTDLSNLPGIKVGVESGAVYNILGQRVKVMRPGNIYIRNGKKIVIR